MRSWTKWCECIVAAGLLSACYSGADAAEVEEGSGDGDGGAPSTHPATLDGATDASTGDTGGAPISSVDPGETADTGVDDCVEPAEPFVAGRVLIGFATEPIPTTIVVGPLQADLVHPLVGLRSGLYAIQGGQTVCAAVGAFTGQASVRYAEPVHIAAPTLVVNDPGRGDQWNFDRVHATEAWDRSTGAGVVVAVLDTGLRAGGEDGVRHLDGVACVNAACTPGGADDTIANFHGTHVAGTIAQTTNNAIGVAALAFDATVLPIKVLHPHWVEAEQTTEHWGDDADIAQGVVYAVDHGAAVINMSLGAQGACSATMTDAIAYANQHGVNVVIAAGNDGLGTISHPANCPGAIAVAATGEDDLLADFSNWDAAAGQGNLAAPGVGILQEFPPSGLGELQGTSMAAPHVAAGRGAAAGCRRPGG